MKDFYCKYYEFTDWQIVKNSLLQLYRQINQQELFYAMPASELIQHVPQAMQILSQAGVDVNHIFFIKFPGPTDLSITDPNDSRTVYIHCDRVDDGSAAENDNRFVNTIPPKYALNIPLLNCESSTTFFYKLKDANMDELPWAGWGQELLEDGTTTIAHSNVERVDQITLDRPALVKIDSPHGVHNPTDDYRVVASVRVSSTSKVFTQLDNN